MPPITNDWATPLKEEYKKEYYKNLYQKVNEEYASGETIFPPADDIFNAFHLTPLNEVKCVIIGQDPYHNVNQAHGLSFSVLPEQKDIPPSLQNIYKELQDDMGQLFAYYGSEVWFEDLERELPPDTKAGVLSEDLVYDTITDARDAAFRMLEIGTDILKNRI